MNTSLLDNMVLSGNSRVK